MLTIEVIRDSGEFCSLKEQWDSLLERSNSQSIFLTWEWLYPWWQHFGIGKELLILLVKDPSTKELIGIAPLFREKRKIRFLGSQKVASDFLGIICISGREREVIEVMLQYFSENKTIWDIIELTDLEGSTVSVVTEALQKHSFPWLPRAAEVCPYLTLDEDYEGIVQSLSQKMRSNLRWQTKQIENKYKMVFTSPQAVDELKNDIDILFNLHDSRFETKKEESAFSNGDIKKFHYDIAENFFLRGWLRMFFLKYENKAIACLYTFQYKGHLFYYQTGFNQSCSKLSLGSVLIGYAIKESIAAGVKTFHFLRGNEEYKKRWTNTAITTQTIMVANRTFAARVYISYISVKKNIKKLVKSFI